MHNTQSHNKNAIIDTILRGFAHKNTVYVVSTVFIVISVPFLFAKTLFNLGISNIAVAVLFIVLNVANDRQGEELIDYMQLVLKVLNVLYVFMLTVLFLYAYIVFICVLHKHPLTME